MDIHYYMLCYRSEALVASHLEPEAFGRYMAVGTQKLSRGSVFFEVAPDLRSDYFRLHDIRRALRAPRRRQPQASKYISVYRVLEHLERPRSASCTSTTADGRMLGLDRPPTTSRRAPGPNLYQELCPVSPMVVSTLAPAAFCALHDRAAKPAVRAAPVLCRSAAGPGRDGRTSRGTCPYSDPLHIEDCIEQWKQRRSKPTKTISRTRRNAFYRTVRRGFFVGDQGGLQFYPFPRSPNSKSSTPTGGARRR